ncbi:hypothetical protein PSP6_160146 [Paraburkholderia tropica]|nr:hypothetical protein PSP6_160146 [Paraburkholderia tropica]
MTVRIRDQLFPSIIGATETRRGLAMGVADMADEGATGRGRRESTFYFIACHEPCWRRFCGAAAEVQAEKSGPQ